MDITPILHRELLTAARRTRLWGTRASLAGMLVAIALATFGARYYWDRGQMSDQDLMARVAFQAFLWMLLAHMAPVLTAMTRGALCIAQEKDRRTLDFLLATRLSNAEIILAKLAACVGFFVADLAVGLPMMLLMNPLGAVDLKLILLAYAGMITTGFFVIALSIWISAGATDSRRAATVSVFATMAWLMGPVFVSQIFTKASFRLPDFMLTMNAWVMTTSPMAVMLKVGGGATPSSGLLDAVAWMGGLQVGVGALLIIWTIVRLRSAYRFNVSGDSDSLLARLTRPGWRWWPKPPVGDDPILWREMHVSRSGLLGTIFGLIIALGFTGAFSYATYTFARPALVEVWRYGYTSGVANAERPEWNLWFRFFLSGDFGVNSPVDIARTEFNLFLRQTTPTFLFLIMLIAAAMASEGIVSERARETWDSLIATPLTAREILRSKALAVICRLRTLLGIVIGLWILGLLAGSIHPLGLLVSTLLAAGSIWLMLAFGISISIGAKDAAATTGPTMILTFAMVGSGVVPFLLPSRLSSVLLASGSPPFIAFLTLVSYRDVRNAWQYPAFPLLQWARLETNEGPLAVALTCGIGILIPAIAGYFLWRRSLNDFDRVIGRPYKIEPAATQPVAMTHGAMVLPAK